MVRGSHRDDSPVSSCAELQCKKVSSKMMSSDDRVRVICILTQVLERPVKCLRDAWDGVSHSKRLLVTRDTSNRNSQKSIEILAPSGNLQTRFKLPLRRIG